MALTRLKGLVHRFYLASPLAFEDWTNPTTAELNANPTNDPDGLIFNVTCALNTDGTTFDLGDPTTDDSLTFCQVAGTSPILEHNPEIVFQAVRSTNPWIVSDTATEDIANLTFSLLAWPDVEYMAIMSVGEEPETPFTVGDRIKMARVATDIGVDVTGSGENTALDQNFLARGDVAWNIELTA